MKLTFEMIQAGTQKAVELGILPRQSHMEDLATNTEIIFEILQATLASIPDQNLDAADTKIDRC